MVDFPATQLYALLRPVACSGSACIVVNGRHVPAGSGVAGCEPATRFGAPGRRTGIISGIQEMTLEDGRFCTPEELKDSRAMPVRIAVIPGHAKGGEPCHGKGRNRVAIVSMEACLTACHPCHACEDATWQMAFCPAVLRPAVRREHTGAGAVLCSLQKHGSRSMRSRWPEGWFGRPDGKSAPWKDSGTGRAQHILFAKSRRTCAKSSLGSDS